jgi:hypothetical protein
VWDPGAGSYAPSRRRERGLATRAIPARVAVPARRVGLKGEGARMEPPLWEAERLKRGLDPAL